MDPLFQIQRYWGSDDSDVDGESGNSNAKLKNVLESIKKKKGVSSNSVCSEKDLAGNDINELSFHNEDNTPPQKRKKKKEKKGSPESDLTLETEKSDNHRENSCVDLGDEDDAGVTIDLRPNKRAKRNRNENDSMVDDSSIDSECSKNHVKKKRKSCSKDTVPEGETTSLNLTSVVKQETDENLSTLNHKDQPSESHELKKSRKRKRKQKSEIENTDENETSESGFVKEEILSDDGEQYNGESVHNQTSMKSKKRKTRKNKRDREKERTENDTQDSDAFPVLKDVHCKNETVQRILPDWLSKPTFIQLDLKEQELPVSELDFLDDGTKGNLSKSSIHHLFPVQFKVIPWLLQSSSKRFLARPSDLCVSAPTGSGKTLAFVIPIVQSLKTRTVRQIRAVVLLPVGDLAVQVYKVFQTFCSGTDLSVSLVIGQKSFQQEKNQLVKKCSRGYMSLTDIIVCTPGRLMDHISRTEGFSLQHVQYLVIDEADRLIEEIQQGLLKKVEDAIYSMKSYSKCKCFGIENCYQKVRTKLSTPCMIGDIREPVQKLLYSATLSQDPDKLHELSLYRPKLFTSASHVLPSALAKEGSEKLDNSDDFIGKYTTPEGLVEQYLVCDPQIKPLIICHLLKKNEFRKVLCFTRSLEHAHRLSLVLSNMLKLNIRELSSNLRAVQRKIILDQFANGKVHVLVCSDMMSRGMDIEDVDCVISYDAPVSITKYVHRIGRTARAGKSGVAITLLEKSETPKFTRMLISGGKLPAVKLELPEEDLADLEDDFKKALASASETISKENSCISLMKKTAKGFVKNVKTFQNKFKRKNSQQRWKKYN